MGEFPASFSPEVLLIPIVSQSFFDLRPGRSRPVGRVEFFSPCLAVQGDFLRKSLPPYVFFFRNFSTPLRQSSVWRAIALISTPASNAASNDMESMLYKSLLDSMMAEADFAAALVTYASTSDEKSSSANT